MRTLIVSVAHIFSFCTMRFLAALSMVLFSFSVGYTQGTWVVYNVQNSLLPDNIIRCLHKDADGALWVGTDNGLAKFENGLFTVTDSSNSNLPSNQIRSITTDTTGQVYVGTMQAGVAVFNGDSFDVYNTQNSLLPDDNVRALIFDETQNLWMGTVGGAVQVTDEGWSVYNINNSPIGSNNINNIFVEETGIVWIGTVNGGIAKKEGNQWTIYKNSNSGLADNTVLDFATDMAGDLWFTTPAQGLGRFNGNTWQYRITANSNIPTNSLTALQLSKNTGIKYIGSTDKGIIRWDNSLVFDSFTVVNSAVPDNYVTCLLLYNDTTLYAGTQSGGLVKFIDTSAAKLVGLNDAANSKFNVFPNPAESVLYFTGANKGTAIFQDVFGRMVLETAITNNPVMIDKYLSKGIYIVTVSTGNEQYSCKVVLQ